MLNGQAKAFCSVRTTTEADKGAAAEVEWDGQASGPLPRGQSDLEEEHYE